MSLQVPATSTPRKPITLTVHFPTMLGHKAFQTYKQVSLLIMKCKPNVHLITLI